MAFELWMWIFFAGGLLILSLTDLKRRVIPNRILIALTLNRAVWLLFSDRPAVEELQQMLPGLCLTGVLLAAILSVAYIWKHPVMGGGDQKLLIVMAFYLNWTELLLAWFLGCLLGTLAKRSGFDRKREHAIPLGPFLSTGAVLTLCFGGPVIQWYLGFAG